MSDDLAIREQIAALVGEEQGIADFEAWLQEFSIDLEESAAALAADALRLLAEHENGDWTDAEVVEHLGALSRLYWFEAAPKSAWADAGGSVTHRDSVAAGTPHAAGSA